MNEFNYRFADKFDIHKILEFIKELAIYEKMIDDVIADENLLNDWLFEKKIAEVIFALEDNKEVGFALFFYNFSTFVGKAGIYLEDLYVKPEFRNKGYGKALFKTLAQIAIDRNCGRMEWCCLNWNKPSIDFYLSMGATPLDEWTTYRLTEEKIKELIL